MTVGTAVAMAIGMVIARGALAGMVIVLVLGRAGMETIARALVIGMVIAAITIIAMAIVAIMMVGGIRLQLLALVQSLVEQLHSQHLSRFTALATVMFSGAIIAISLIGLQIIRSSLITAHVSSATRRTVNGNLK